MTLDKIYTLLPAGTTQHSYVATPMPNGWVDHRYVFRLPEYATITLSDLRRLNEGGMTAVVTSRDGRLAVAVAWMASATSAAA